MKAKSGRPRAISFWYSQLQPPPARRDPLPGSRRADVCIVGAGLTGLWTAYELLRRHPDLEVVVADLLLERDTGVVDPAWAGSMGRPWPPDPIRFVAVRGVNAMMAVADRQEWSTNRPAAIDRLPHVILGCRVG